MLFAVRAIKASHVNVIMNDFAAGMPSPLATLGLAAAIAPSLGVERWSVGCLPVFHSVDVSEGRTKPEMERKSDRFSPVESPEDMKATVFMSLLLDLPGCKDQTAVSDALAGRRIAGGVIANKTIDVQLVTDDSRAFAGMPRGYVMTPPNGEAGRIVASGRADELARIASVLYPAPSERKDCGWLIPVSVGYRLIEDPATVPRRTGVRDHRIPHVFAEPLVGVAELISVRNRRVTETSGQGLQSLLWRWKSEGEWIVGHSAYHPDTAH